MWTTKPDAPVLQPPAAMVKLKTAAVFQCDLDVRAKRILGMVPFSWSFAMRELPPGTQARVPPALAMQIVEASMHPAKDDPDELERLLLKIIPSTRTVTSPVTRPSFRQMEPYGARRSRLRIAPSAELIALPSSGSHAKSSLCDNGTIGSTRACGSMIRNGDGYAGSKVTGRRKRSLVVLAMGLIVTANAATPAWAWGRIGHRVVSRFAESQLSPKAKASITSLLMPGESLADASVWADEHRRELPKSAPWHYVDVPLDEPRYHSIFSGDVPERGHVVDKIHDFKVAVKDSSRSLEERRIALRFLIHFVEDLHMPMHVGDNNDKGGQSNPSPILRPRDEYAQSLGQRDDRICLRHRGLLAQRSGALDTPPAHDAASKGTVEDWATESLLAARQAYQVPETGRRLKPGQKLADAYLDANLPVVRRRLFLAAVRVATVLNQTLGDE